MYNIKIPVYKRVLNRGQIQKSAVFFCTKPHPVPMYHRGVPSPKGRVVRKKNSNEIIVLTCTLPFGES
jgi:hypothetical protein